MVTSGSCMSPHSCLQAGEQRLTSILYRIDSVRRSFIGICVKYLLIPLAQVKMMSSRVWFAWAYSAVALIVKFDAVKTTFALWRGTKHYTMDLCEESWHEDMNVRTGRSATPKSLNNHYWYQRPSTIFLLRGELISKGADVDHVPTSFMLSA